jgi:predicted nucleic acid-binding protein
LADRKILVFLDACVLIAAAHSQTGGSALVIEVCRGFSFKATVSVKVLLEARINIAEKFAEPELVRFYQLLADLDPEMVPSLLPENLDRCESLVTLKDVHVLAAALQSGAAYLITLDKRHFMTPVLQAAGLSVKIMTPGDFLKAIVN